MPRDDNELNCGVEYDKMTYCRLSWKGLTFWGIPDGKAEGAFVAFESYSIRKMVTYKMVALVPSAKCHPSCWNLDIIRFGEKKPVSQLNKHEILQNVTFEELFAVMGVLLDEEENPNIFEYISQKELERIKKKWKRWMKDLPDWLDTTIEVSDKRVQAAQLKRISGNK